MIAQSVVSPCAQAALEYASMGWFVLPLWWPDVGAPTSIEAPSTRHPLGRVLGGCACGSPACTSPGKHPIGPLVGAGKDNASIDAGAIGRWFEAYPLANVGIATERSGIVVLDVDITEGKPGRESLASIDAQLVPTRSAMTGSGGLHAVFARPGDVEAFTRIGALPGLDIIGDGYIVAAPSRHKSGGTYRWNDPRAPVVPMPIVLRELRRARVEIAASDIGVAKIAEGGRNAAMFRLGAAMRATGIDRDAVRAVMVLENRRRFDPPLPDDEVDQLVGKVMRHARVDRDVAYGAVLTNEIDALFPDSAPLLGGLPESCTIRELIPRLEADAKLPIVHLPFSKLDDKLGGLQLHSTTVLIAPPGKGKTSLAGQIGVHHAREHGPVIVYVGEMTRQLWMARVAGQQLGRRWIDVIMGKVPSSAIDKAIGDLPILFVGRCDAPMRAIARACDRAVALGWRGTPMIIVDYLQLLAEAGKDMRAAMASSFRELQHFTEQAPIVALDLSQTSRPGAKAIRAGTERAEDLGDTGAESSEIERGATNLLVLSYQSKDDVVEHQVTMAVGKGRFGGNTKFGFLFNGETGLWTATDKPPVDDDHENRCAEVAAQLMTHGAGRCMAGSQPCGRDLTPAALYTPRSIHKIPGTREQVLRAVEDLIDMGRMIKLGSTLMQVNK